MQDRDVTSVIGTTAQHTAHVGIPHSLPDPANSCAACVQIERAKREAIDAFIRDELPGLLAGYDLLIEDTEDLLEGVQLTSKGAQNIAVKIAELRRE